MLMVNLARLFFVAVKPDRRLAHTLEARQGQDRLLGDFRMQKKQVLGGDRRVAAENCVLEENAPASVEPAAGRPKSGEVCGCADHGAGRNHAAIFVRVIHAWCGCCNYLTKLFMYANLKYGCSV